VDGGERLQELGPLALARLHGALGELARLGEVAARRARSFGQEPRGRVARLGHVGREPHRRAVFLECLRFASQARETPAEVEVLGRRFGRELDGLAEVLQRFLAPPERRERHAQVAVRVGVLRLRGQERLVVRHGLRVPSQLLQAVGEEVVVDGVR
jgi:hypothetical protein